MALGPAGLALPFAIYLLLVSRLWANAPVWDDYLAIVNDALILLDAPSAYYWLADLFKVHVEHRIATVRIVTWGLAKTVGYIDFRVLFVLGAASVLGVALMMWAELRREVPAILFLAAGLLLFQCTYFEAALTATSLSSFLALLFAFAALYFAIRPGMAAATLCVAFALLAIGSQANGLFVLPIAAVAGLYLRQRPRTLLYTVVAIVAWALYMRGLQRPVSHPSPLFALEHPIAALRFFLLIVGSIVPGMRIPEALGAIFLAVAGWLVARRGLWRRHPAAVLWIAFLFASIAAATVGRVGLGVVYTSRYAVYSSALAVLLLLGTYTVTAPWSRARIGLAVVAAAFVSVAATWLIWPAAYEYSIYGRRLAEAVPASPDVHVQRYFGMFFPIESLSQEVLVRAGARGVYSPRRVVVYRTQVVARSGAPAGTRIAGSFDNLKVEGSTVTVGGWTDIPASVAGRTIAIVSAAGPAAPGPVSYDDRADVAMLFRAPALEFGGFHLSLEYPSEELAQRAAASMCIVVSAPGHGEAILARKGVDCAGRFTPVK